MADIKLRIEVNPNAESEFLGTASTTNLNVANTSIKLSPTGEMKIPKTEFDGSNGLLWGEEDYLVFNDNDELDNVENTGGYLESEENPDEFFWGLVPPNKEYSVKLTFTGASNLKDIVVFGDKVNNQFPTEAIVDGEKTIYSDDYHWAINLGTEKNEHTIEFTKWNRANYNACITLIRVMLRYIEIDKFNGLKSVESLWQSTGQPKDIFYGIVGSSGSAEIIDVNGEILDAVNNSIITQSNNHIQLLINNNVIAKQISIDTDYDANAMQLNMSFSDEISSYSLVEYGGVRPIGEYASQIYIDNPSKNVYKDNHTSLYSIFTDALNAFGYTEYEINRILSRIIIESINGAHTELTIKDYLKNFYFSLYDIEQTDKKSLIDMVCNIAQLNGFIDENGEFNFCSSRPIASNKSRVGIIKANHIIATPQKDIFINNKYNNVSILVNNYNLKSTQLLSLKAESAELSAMEAKVEAASFWESSYYADMDAVLSDDSLSKEFYTDDYGRDWIICYKTETLTNYYRVYSPLYIYKISENTWGADYARPSVIVRYGDKQFTLQSPLNSYGMFPSGGGTIEDGINAVKQKIQTLSNDIPSHFVVGGFLGNNYPTYSLGSSPVTGKFINEQTPVFAFMKSINAFPIQVYFSSYPFIYTSVDGSSGSGALIKDELSISTHTNTYGDDNGECVAKIDYQNRLMSNTLFYGEYNAEQLIASNILDDYKDGIHTARVSVICGNYYDENGQLYKDWSKQEIYQLGEIVRIDKNDNNLWNYANDEPIYWKITGRNFHKTGVPLIDLELQEVKLVNVK